MRALHLVMGSAILIGTPVLAQTPGGVADGGATMGAAGFVDGAGRTPQLGQPPAPLGTTTTLSERIDNAAGLDSRRAILNGTAGSLGPSAGRTTGNTLPGTAGLESAGRPAGTPLGTGASGVIAPAAAPSADPRNPG